MLNIPAKLRGQVRRRLKDEYFIWMTTVGTDLTPQPRPVWFVWEAATGSFLIYSQPDARKMAHIAQHPRVALHFNSDLSGDNDILVFLGDAHVDPDAPPPHKQRGYMRKYRDGIAGLGMSPEEMGREYSSAIRVVPTAVRGW
jgi:PPOX class probable F420-dependent enzyme